MAGNGHTVKKNKSETDLISTSFWSIKGLECRRLGARGGMGKNYVPRGGQGKVREKRPTNPTVPGGEEFVLGSPDFKSSSALVK